MRFSSALALQSLVAASALSAPPALDIPAEVRPAGQYALFTPKTDAVAIEFIGLDAIDPVPSSVLKDARTFLLDTRGLAKGRYRFVAVGSSATGELARVAFVLVVGDSPGPGPTPPGPTPPPDDALLATLRAAFGADQSPTKREDVRKLAAIFRESGVVVDDPALTTYRQVNDAVGSVTRAAVPITRLTAVREIVRDEFNRHFGTNDGVALTPELRARLRALLVRMATLYEELGR